MQTDEFSFSSLAKDTPENALLEKCVVSLQMLTYVGDDLYDKYISNYQGNVKGLNLKFIKDNSSFIDY